MSSEAVPEVARSKPVTPARVFLVIAVALLLLKLLLVSRREMAPETHDAEAYASASLQQLGSLLTVGAGHPPGASLVMAMARSLGIPYRIFIEVSLSLAAFLFLRPLVVSMRLGIVAVALSYALLLFNPDLILEMDRPMSDSVSFLCWLIGAGGIHWICRRAPGEASPVESRAGHFQLCIRRNNALRGRSNLRRRDGRNRVPVHTSLSGGGRLAWPPRDPRLPLRGRRQSDGRSSAISGALSQKRLLGRERGRESRMVAAL